MNDYLTVVFRDHIKMKRVDHCTGSYNVLLVDEFGGLLLDVGYAIRVLNKKRDTPVQFERLTIQLHIDFSYPFF